MSEKAMTGKDILKRVAPVAIALVLILIIVLIVTSVKSCSNQTPKIENGNEVYVKLNDDLEITNERLYTYLKQNYGLSELLRLVDNDLYSTEIQAVLADETKKAELDKFILKSIFSVEVDNVNGLTTEYAGKPQEEWNNIANSLLMNNLIKNEDLDTDEEKDVFNTSSKLWDTVRKYYALQYVRTEWAKAEYVKQLQAAAGEGEKLFASDKIETYYKENYSGTVKGIFIPFTSEKAALDAMKRAGINTNSTVLAKNGWLTSAVDYNETFDLEEKDENGNKKYYLNATQVYDAIIKMYNEVYNFQGSQITSECFTTTVDLAKTVNNAKVALDAVINAKKASVKNDFELPLSITVKDFANPVSVEWSFTGAGVFALGEDNKTVTYTAPTTDTTVTFTATLKLVEGEGENAKEATATATYNIVAKPLDSGVDQEPLAVWAVDAVNKFETYTFNFDELAENKVAFDWDTNSLTKINSSLATYLKYDSSYLKLTDVTDEFYKSYTVKPISVGDYYVIMVKFEQEAAKSVDDVEAEIIEKLTEAELTDNNINKMVYENRYNNGLAIYDRYLEALYDYQYTYFYETTLKLTDYNKYKDSKKKENSVVAKYKVNGVEKTITAEDLFKSLEEKYGVSTTIDLINQYQIITNKENNKIYNPYTNEVYDKDTMSELLTSEIGNFRKNFELNYFTYSYLSSYGFTPNFPKEYGWNNFKKDYFGAFSDEELLANANFGGSVYSEALNNLKKKLYTDYDDVTDQASFETTDVYKAMKEAYDKWYGLSVLNLIVYIDNNFDSSIDQQTDLNTDVDGYEKSDWNDEQRGLVNELINLIFEKASETGDTTLSAQITSMVTVYKNASYEVPATLPTANDTIYTYNYWAKFKKAGLLIKFETSADYNSTSSLVQPFLDELEVMYKKAKALNLEGTFDVPMISDKNVETVYGYHKIIATAMTTQTALPTYEDVQIYQLVNQATNNNGSTVSYKKALYDEAVKVLKEKYEIEWTSDYAIDTELKGRIDAWYTNAVNEVSGNDVLSQQLIDYLEANKAKIVASNPTEYSRLLEIILKVSKEDLEKDE